MEALLETSVCFVRDRLVFAGLKKEEQQLWSNFSAEWFQHIPVIDA